MSYYYDISEDLKKYPDCWVYIIIGGRNTGKTYSTLYDAMHNQKKFVFLKRTIDDVKLLCSGSGKIGAKQNQFGMDLSPFKSINRDYKTDIRAYSIRDGLGGFWQHVNGEPEGVPIGYLLGLNAVSKYKGFDLSECQEVIFDEFIPQPWDRINRKEGEQLMDLYKTVERDREHRGLPALKLICLANATSIYNPTMAILELTDTVADMEINGRDIYHDPDRGIFVHIIKDNEAFKKKETESKLYRAMAGTNWGRMAFDNTFAYNDFSAVGKQSLKGYRPVCSVKYKQEVYYIYQKDGQYYVTLSKHNAPEKYDLNIENQQKLFYYERVLDLQNDSINGDVTFETYTMYELIMNYKQFFKL